MINLKIFEVFIHGMRNFHSVKGKHDGENYVVVIHLDGNFLYLTMNINYLIKFIKSCNDKKHVAFITGSPKLEPFLRAFPDYEKYMYTRNDE